MKFEEALYNFVVELRKEYGSDAPIVKIGVSYDMYNRIMSDTCDKYRFNLIDLCEPSVLGVRVVPLKIEKF